MDGVAMLPANRHSTHTRVVRKVVRDSGVKMVVTEGGGVSIKRILQRGDLEDKGRCDEVECTVSKMAEKHSKRCLRCRVKNVCYEVICICMACMEVGRSAKDVGETGRIAYTKVAEHLRGRNSGEGTYCHLL